MSLSVDRTYGLVAVANTGSPLLYKVKDNHHINTRRNPRNTDIQISTDYIMSVSNNEHLLR